MNPIELKTWQSGLGLSELAFSAYLGVPVHTLRKWLNGTRHPDAAPCRLFAVLQRIESDASTLHDDLIEESRTSASDKPVARIGRPPKARVALSPVDASQADPGPAAPQSDIPGWLRMAL